MKAVSEPESGVCPQFHKAIELIGRRWSGAIIFVLMRSRARFAEIRAAVPGMTDRMLSERLQELEQEGIVERTVIPDTPVRVEYALTKKGRALVPVVDSIVEWAHEFAAPVPAARVRKRRG